MTRPRAARGDRENLSPLTLKDPTGEKAGLERP
jgi:hypothetical protein